MPVDHIASNAENDGQYPPLAAPRLEATSPGQSPHASYAMGLKAETCTR